MNLPPQPESERVKARKQVNEAVRKGAMKRPTRCSQCGATGMVHAHHTDYVRPKVRWLCPKCHSAEHPRR